MIIMWLSQEADGRDVAAATWKDELYTVKSRTGVTMKLARVLRDHGAPDDEWCACSTHTQELLFKSDRTLHQWAELSMSEGNGSPRLTAFWPGFPSES